MLIVALLSIIEVSAALSNDKILIVASANKAKK